MLHPYPFPYPLLTNSDARYWTRALTSVVIAIIMLVVKETMRAEGAHLHRGGSPSTFLIRIKRNITKRVQIYIDIYDEQVVKAV
ncbi:unnamed protein product [Amoebophrya sp. A25]|nr:unnamed protein product [Amoebophrya sp. A25]|eukprot:GSA25T00008320001.1